MLQFASADGRCATLSRQGPARCWWRFPPAGGGFRLQLGRGGVSMNPCTAASHRGRQR